MLAKNTARAIKEKRITYNNENTFCHNLALASNAQFAMARAIVNPKDARPI